MAVRERMPDVDEIDVGKVLIHGIHTINNLTRSGTYLILFNESIVIDNRNFSNDKELIVKYLQNNKPGRYEILDVLESQNEKLKIPPLTIIDKIPMELETHPIRSTITILTAVVTIIMVLHYSIKIFKQYNNYRLRKIKEKRNAYVKALFNKKLGTISFGEGES